MTRRAPPAFDVVTGKIDRDRNAARSLEQAKHIEGALTTEQFKQLQNWLVAQSTGANAGKPLILERNAKGELRAIRDIMTAATDAAGASPLISSYAQQAIITQAVRSAEADRVFARLNGSAE